MHRKENNFAYIDSANLKMAAKELGWPLDYARFRIWLSEKYSIQRAYLFIGLISRFGKLYTYLQECGFTLVFKEVIFDHNGKPKGNCDADLVLQATRDTYENHFERAIIVTSDGDFSSLIRFLDGKDKLLTLISPNIAAKCSVLLKRTGVDIVYLHDKRSILEAHKKKPPMRTVPHKGLFRNN